MECPVCKHPVGLWQFGTRSTLRCKHCGKVLRATNHAKLWKITGFVSLGLTLLNFWGASTFVGWNEDVRFGASMLSGVETFVFHFLLMKARLKFEPA